MASAGVSISCFMLDIVSKSQRKRIASTMIGRASGSFSTYLLRFTCSMKYFEGILKKILREIF